MMNCNTNVTAPGVSISKKYLQSLTFGIIRQVKKSIEISKVTVLNMAFGEICASIFVACVLIYYHHFQRKFLSVPLLYLRRYTNK